MGKVLASFCMSVHRLFADETNVFISNKNEEMLKEVAKQTWSNFIGV